MAYIRKTVDRWDIMSNYGYGWECECSLIKIYAEPGGQTRQKRRKLK